MFRIIHFLMIKGQLLSLCDRRISFVEFFKMKTHFIRFSFSVNTSIQNGIKKKKLLTKHYVFFMTTTSVSRNVN